jgi:hypothetical protein
MNERIKQITGQVLDEIVPETWVALGYDKIKEIQNRTTELIVKECIAQAVKEEERYDSLGGRDCGYCSMAMSNFQGVLAKHFGVEE